MLQPETKFTGAVVFSATADIAVPHAATRQQGQIARRQSNRERCTDDELLPVARINSIQNRANNSARDPYREKDFDLL